MNPSVAKASDTEMGQNILYITIDAIRADRVGFLTGEHNTTPVIDNLARKGTAVERAVANGIPTYYSFKSLLGGIHSLSHTQEIGLPSTAQSIAEVFQKAGYATAGFNGKNPWLTKSYRYDRGFQTYQDFMGSGDFGIGFGQLTRQAKQTAKRAVAFSDFLTDRLGRYSRITNTLLGLQPLQPAESVTKAAVKWINSLSGERPFFLWIHYMEPHYPWTPPAQYLNEGVRNRISRINVGSIWHTVAHKYKKETTTIDRQTLGQIKDLYDAEIRRVDSAIGRLLDVIRTESELRETTVAVAGDHGTELGDHGGFSHGPQTLYDELLHVPLLFHGYNVPNDTKEIAALVDVPQTLIGLVEDVSPPETFEGIDLFRGTRESVSSEVIYDFDPAQDKNLQNGLLQAQTEPPWKLIRNQHTGTTNLYHIGDDPSEQSPVTDADKIRSELEAALDQHREKIDTKNKTIEEKERIKRRIAELKVSKRF